MTNEMVRIDFDEIEVNPDYYYFHNGKPFTGIAYETAPDGWLRSEMTFVNGMQDGVSRDWFDNGQMDSETYFRKGVPHGLNREWDEQGRLREESMHEFGVRTELKQWDEHGHLTNHWKIGRDDIDYQYLLNNRASVQQQVAR